MDPAEATRIAEDLLLDEAPSLGTQRGFEPWNFRPKRLCLSPSVVNRRALFALDLFWCLVFLKKTKPKKVKAFF